MDQAATTVRRIWTVVKTCPGATRETGWHLADSIIVAATLVAKGLAAAYGARPLFSGLDLVVAPGDVIGLVGVNGAGKSTLLRLLAGLDQPESGQVVRNPAEVTVGYLPQLVERSPGETVGQFLGRRTGVTQAEAEMERAAQDLTEGGAGDPYAVALERWLALGGADLPERAEVVLADLGGGLGADRLLPDLSGGQAARVNLAAVLLARFDVFLLDEPTNDLDLDGLSRLETFMAGLRAGTVLVSHDREFLARTATDVLELDLAQQQVALYGGGYEAYLTERETARRHARQRYDDYADTVSGLQERARMQRSWLDAGIRKAVTRQRDNDKIGRKFRVEQTEKQAAKARQTERLLERLPEVAEPRKEWELQYTIAAAPRSGAVVATARGAVVRRGTFTLGPLNLQVDAGDRIGITGPNGTGKTTLLRLLLQQLEPDEGVAGLGASVAVGEVDQARSLLAGAPTLLSAFEAQLPDQVPSELRTLLAKFSLTAEHVMRPVSSLSPGEQTRAALALLQARGVNLLVLDEPTNHLDLAAIEQLESALESYTGTLLLVTHDRRMLEAVQLTRRWSLADGRVRED